MAQHHIRSGFADPVGDLPALAQSRLEFAIGPTEKRHLTGPTEGPRSRPLFLLTDDNQLGRVLAWIPRALGPVGAHQMVDVTPVVGPFGEGAAATELDVVGMGADGQGAARRRQVQ